MYMATLVSDDTPFDRLMAGQGAGYSSDAVAGLGLFFGKGKCAACHGGAEFTNASVRKIKREPIGPHGHGQWRRTAVYDEGFYNISIDQDAGGHRQRRQQPAEQAEVADAPGPAGGVGRVRADRRHPGQPERSAATERIAINGAFKTPTLRNVELTAPYFHDGSVLTLEQVVEFYNRGGNHFQNNLHDVDADIEPLGLTADERTQLVAFLKSLTDERVRFQRAPFDHPQLNALPEGQKTSSTSTARTINVRRPGSRTMPLPLARRGPGWA